MFSLSGVLVNASGSLPAQGNLILRVSLNVDQPRSLREREAFLVRDGAALPDGYRAYLSFDGEKPPPCAPSPSAAAITLPASAGYLVEGDIIRISHAQKKFRVLYRRQANANHFLVTERCNHLCLMCSQPPRNVSDGWLVDEIVETFSLIDPSERFIGITGGEPTLLGADLIRLLVAAKAYLPRAAVHILTNGRRFAEPAFLAPYVGVRHPNLTAGIPLYADVPSIHDYVVQSHGAFDETIRGILALKAHKQRVEVRVVVHKQTYSRLLKLAEFIARNLTFVDHVAFMGLELTGFTLANLGDLWIDPYEYRDVLGEAVSYLDAQGINISIYNHQLCTLDHSVWRFAKKSISDWKNNYFPECDECAIQELCGGFFASANLRRSAHIRPVTASNLPMPPVRGDA